MGETPPDQFRGRDPLALGIWLRGLEHDLVRRASSRRPLERGLADQPVGGPAAILDLADQPRLGPSYTLVGAGGQAVPSLGLAWRSCRARRAAPRLVGGIAGADAAGVIQRAAIEVADQQRADRSCAAVDGT